MSLGHRLEVDRQQSQPKRQPRPEEMLHKKWLQPGRHTYCATIHCHAKQLVTKLFQDRWLLPSGQWDSGLTNPTYHQQAYLPIKKLPSLGTELSRSLAFPPDLSFLCAEFCDVTFCHNHLSALICRPKEKRLEEATPGCSAHLLW